jgi:hypothetical protein
MGDQPALWILVPAEGPGTVGVICESAEDQERLLNWLTRASLVDEIAAHIRRLAYDLTEDAA